VAAKLVRDHHLAGLSVTTENVADEAQVRALTAAIGDAVAADGRTFPPVVGVDQEGGVVAHLRGVATDFPAFAAAGTAIERQGRAGAQAVRGSAYATGMELRDLGFTWVFAPVADVTVGSADPTIGSRSPSTDPAVAATAVGAAVRGYNGAGVVSTTKHFPGHGTATADSHETLPEVPASRAALAERDLVPFEEAVTVGAPAVMVAHLDVAAVAPGVPSSLAPEVYDLLRDDLGFEGVTLTDSLGMGGVAGRPEPGLTALQAGADLLLMPPDPARTHGVLTDALESGRLSRERAEEAAARVVALQLWQQRMAARTPVPADAAARAAAAAADLSAAAYG
jgi:beta-N-acetylhexosaminidase